MQLRLIHILFLPILLAACEPTVANRGCILETDKLSDIKVGTTTREDVATKLGTPTQTSTFDDKTWYYVGRQTEQYSFLDPEVTKQQAIQICFDDKGVVTSVDNLDLSKAQDVIPVARSTPTYGNDNTFIEQLIGNLGHPTPNMGGNKQQGQ